MEQTSWIIIPCPTNHPPDSKGRRSRAISITPVIFGGSAWGEEGWDRTARGEGGSRPRAGTGLYLRAHARSDRTRKRFRPLTRSRSLPRRLARRPYTLRHRPRPRMRLHRMQASPNESRLRAMASYRPLLFIAPFAASQCPGVADPPAGVGGSMESAAKRPMRLFVVKPPQQKYRAASGPTVSTAARRSLRHFC
jgi:hypothetical protein